MAGTKEGAAKRKQGIKGQHPVLVSIDEVADFAAAHAQCPAEEPDHLVYVVAPKRALKFGDTMLQAGDDVPGAHLWPRLESWINTGRIVEKTCL